MKAKKRFAVRAAFALFIVAVLALSFGFMACGDKEPEPEEARLESISLDTSNVQTTFDYGDEFTYAGLVVTAHMSDGTTQPVDLDDCRVTTPDLTSPGTRVVNVVYSGKSARYRITVRERVMPPISDKAMIEIPADAATVYRVEAEDIDLEVSGAESAGGNIEQTDETAGIDYIGNYGVSGNYFGFTFTSAEEYTDVTLVLHMSNPGVEPLAPGSAMKMYLNYENSENTGNIDISDMSALPVMQTTVVGDETEEGGTTDGEAGEGETEEPAEEPETVTSLVWEERTVRGLTIAEGTNTLTFDIIDSDVPNIDYIEFYVGTMYINSRVDISEEKVYVKEFEDFDLDKIAVRQDIKDAHHLGDGEAFVETPSTNLENTSGGKSVGAFIPPTEISTVISNAERATVKILFTAASVNSVKIKDNFEFYIDGKRLEEIQDLDIKEGDPGRMEYWQWKDTSLGFVDLEPGAHLFTVKMVAQTGAINADCFKFDVRSYGEFTEHVDDVDMPDVNVTASGVKHTLEAEDLIYTLGASAQTPAGNAYLNTSGWRSMNVTPTKGNTFGFDVNSGAAASAKMRIYAAWGGDQINFDDVYALTNNDAAVTTGATLVKDEGADTYTYVVTPADEEQGTEAVTATEKKYTYNNAFNWNWKVIEVDLTLAAGANEIRFEVKDGATAAVNFDKFEIIVTQYDGGEVYEIPDVMKEDCIGTIAADAVTTRVEAEDADYSEAAMGYGNLHANQTFTETAGGAAGPITSGLVVGKLGLKGNKIVFNVWSDAAFEDASIRFSMAEGDNLKGGTRKVNETLKFTFNEDTITAPDEAAFTGYNDTYQFWNWEPFMISGVSIKAGINTLVIEAIRDDNKVPNIDYIEFYVSTMHINSRVDISEEKVYVKEFEDFDLDKIAVRQDIKDAHHLGDGEAFVETPSTNLENTSGGKSVGAFIPPTEISTVISNAERATVKILFAAASVDSVKIKDNFEFYIDGKRLEEIQDLDIKEGNPGAMEFWQWKDTSLGFVDLEPGVHLFTVKMVAQTGALNADCFKFDVRSYGEFTEHVDDVDMPDVNVDGFLSVVTEIA